ncbi:MAG: MinD/ParA family protein [Sedimentisphaerales bacterium]|nr:MinD/ParA family protein [Sedimentisphaerales bacterium]
MLVDQAEKLRLMVRQTKKTAHILAVTSGKGGVGKSNISANLAICLTAAGKSVLLIDADLGLANLDVLLNVRARYNLSHVIAGKRSIEQIVQNAPGGVRLICGASGLSDLADLTPFQRQRIVQELTALEHQADFIIIDTGAGISSGVLSFCEAADQTLVVTTPEPPSITDAYAVIKRLAQGHSGTKISLLVNMAPNRSEARKVYQRLAQTAAKFISTVVYDAGYVLRDEHVPEAVNQSEPLVLAYPRCPAGYCFLALAGKLGRVSEPANVKSGFFHRVMNWFY